MYYLIGLKTCSTCRQIEKLLRQADITYQYQDVRTDRPTADQIRGWLSSINEENIDKLVNTHGQVYRERQLKNDWKNFSVEEKIQTLALDGMLIKRPILITDNNRLFVGNEVKNYLEEGANRG